MAAIALPATCIDCPTELVAAAVCSAQTETPGNHKILSQLWQEQNAGHASAGSPPYRHGHSNATQLSLRRVHFGDLHSQPHQLLGQDAHARLVALLSRKLNVLLTY
jgi:hypothetical protein